MIIQHINKHDVIGVAKVKRKQRQGIGIPLDILQHDEYFISFHENNLVFYSYQEDISLFNAAFSIIEAWEIINDFYIKENDIMVNGVPYTPALQNELDSLFSIPQNTNIDVEKTIKFVLPGDYSDLWAPTYVYITE